MANDDSDLDYIDIEGEDDAHQRKAKAKKSNSKEDQAGDNNATNYSWEEQYKRSWDVLQEDESGSLEGVVQSLLQQKKRKRLLRDTATIQRGIIRHLYLILDLSTAMTEKDLRPSRLELTINSACEFVQEYFDQNPISQLGIIITRDGIAEKLTELSGNPMDHVQSLQKKTNQETAGEPSLQNALELARACLMHVPAHGSREILVVFGSLTTCDPGDLKETIKSLQKNNVRVSVVALAAEVQICKVLCKETKGTFSVPLNEIHFKEILFELIPPLAVTSASKTSNMVVMGFPTRINEKNSSLCVCHQRLIKGGYRCPRCSSKVCELPTECDVCSLMLVSSPHLARSYHHLFPVENFLEVPWAKATVPRCRSCQAHFEPPPKSTDLQPPPPRPKSAGEAATAAAASHGTGRFQCPRCQEQFCFECDGFVHEILHNCPGCMSITR